MDRKEYMREYEQSEKRRAKKREYMKKYSQTKERKAYMREYNKRYRETNIEKEKERNKIYNQTKEHKIHRREYNKEYISNRRKEDSLFKLRHNIRTLISKCVKDKGYRKDTKTEQILGCTIEEFIAYLQSKFKEGMTLENHRRMAHRPHNTYI